jgi:hypothetical protein
VTGRETARALLVPRLVLATAAVLFAAFGIAFAAAPGRLAATVDLPLPTTTATADFVATYGGFEIGFAVFLFTCLARPERVRLGLLASGWAVAGFAIARGAAILVLGGVKPVLYYALVFEVVCATIAFVAATRAEPAPAPH